MAARFDPTDPRHLTLQQRLDELAAVLALGARRALALRAETAISADSTAPRPPEESAENPLDVSPQLSVHVPVRLTEVQAGEGVEA